MVCQPLRNGNGLQQLACGQSPYLPGCSNQHIFPLAAINMSPDSSSRNRYSMMQDMLYHVQAVGSGDIKIVPDRFEKIYNRWLENIKDWCISRQLWWGHRIPVYYVFPSQVTSSQRLLPYYDVL